MTILKNIFRFAVAGLLVCGLCASSAQPSLAAAVKDTKQAAKNGRDYVNKLYFEMADAMNEAYKCAGNKLPRDIEKYYWHPSALLLCKPQQEAAAQLCLGAGKFLLADALLQEQTQLLLNLREHHGAVGWRGTGVHVENACVVIAAGVGIHAVGHTQFLTDTLEQTAAHAGAQNVVEGGQHVPVGMVGIQAGEHQQQMVLLAMGCHC